MSNTTEFKTRKDFARHVIERRKYLHFIPEIGYSDDPAYIIWLDQGCYWSKGFLLHSDTDDLGSFMEIIAEYCKDKNINQFADMEHIEELRKDSLEAGHDEDDFVNDFYMYTESGYINNPLHIDVLISGRKEK